MRHRFGLKARFISLILVLLTTLYLIIVVVLVHRNTVTQRQNLADRSMTFAALATLPIGNTYLSYQDSGTVLISQQIQKFTELDSNITNVSIVDTSGAVQYSLAGKPTPVSAAEAQSFEPTYKYAGGAISRAIYPFLEEGGLHRYGIVYDISSASVNSELSHLYDSILMYSTAGLIVSAPLTYLAVSRLFLRPLKQLRDKAIVISSGNYTEQIPRDRNDEIGDLAVSVNQMADRLKSDIQKLTEVDQIKSEFMMIASHNLRTPLTIIEGYLSMARKLALTPELSRLLGSIQANSQRLGIFAEDLLTISSIESGEKIYRTDSLEIQKLLETIAADFSVLTKEKNIHFEVTLEAPGVSVLGSKAHLRGAIWNLLENALKFTPAEGTIRLTLAAQASSVHITVADTGIGIAPEELDKLFTKFHRGTSTVTYNYEGSGIGLYVTKLIINEHSGTIGVESTPGKGAVFTVVLPVAVQSLNA